MTYAPRGMSLASRANIDPFALIEQAKRKIGRGKLPMKVSWENLTFKAEVATTAVERAANPTWGKTRRLDILKSVSGYAAPGQTTYIMGASGAGKTSLVNILADRISSATPTWLSGNVLFNDEIPVTKHTFQRFCGYVQQDDVLFGTFTVTEALTFAARLKLKNSHEEQDNRVQEIIRDLGLSHVANSRIGSKYKKILPNGERKRLSIGIELVSDPSIIILDEPTSGLDSFMARSICELLQYLAREKGKTVLATIH
jgi:ABC-type multidrug transport system ATPase subunit